MCVGGGGVYVYSGWWFECFFCEHKLQAFPLTSNVHAILYMQRTHTLLFTQGVVKALFDHKLLPRVLSGSSVGSIGMW